MWITYSEMGEQVTPLHVSEMTEKRGKWLPAVDAETLFRCDETDLEDAWEAELVNMTHERFVAFMAWIWQGEDDE